MTTDDKEQNKQRMTAFLIEKNTEVKKNLIIIVIVAIDILNNVKVTLWNDRQKLFY